MPGMPLRQRLALSETARKRLARILAGVLIAVIVVCVVIVVVALIKQGRWTPRINYPTTHFSTTTTTTPSHPGPYYKNCDEAHADGRWDIPEGDAAYRPELDKDHNGIACESRHR